MVRLRFCSKAALLVPAQPLVLAGSGPLLLLIAAQLQRAGVAIAAVLDTTPAENYASALKHLPGALRNLPLLGKGLGLVLELRRSGVRRFSAVRQLRAIAGKDGRLGAVQFRSGGQLKELPCATLLVHQGVVPNVQLTRALGLAHDWDELQQCWPAGYGSVGRVGAYRRVCCRRLCRHCRGPGRRGGRHPGGTSDCLADRPPERAPAR